jgi:methylisocitrate lyase
MHATEMGLKTIKNEGSQKSLISKMQTRKDLYALTLYEKYNELDQSLFNFKV